MAELSRRLLLQLSAASAGHGLLGCATPTDEAAQPPLFMGGWVTSLLDEHDYVPQITGTLPPGLRGRLYRNGPGLFERDGLRKRLLIDGDGMVNAYFFDGSGVRFKNRFVHTDKWLEEEQAGRYVYDSWTTKAPDTGNIPHLSSQAGVSARVFAERLFAFDEVLPPYELDPGSLATLGMPEFAHELPFSPHPKIVGDEWFHFGIDPQTGKLEVLVFDAQLAIVERRSLQLDGTRFAHDFYVTGRYIVVPLMPIQLDFARLLEGASVWQAYAWDPSLGTTYVIFDRNAPMDAAPRIVAGMPLFSWHTVNMYEDGDALVGETVAYTDAGHFLGEAADMALAMQGQAAAEGARSYLHRVVIDGSGIHEETALDAGHLEFPIVAIHGAHHPAMYCAYNPRDGFFWSGVMRFDGETIDSFDFGAGYFCGEPIFASDEGHETRGWLLSEVGSAERGQSFLAIFDAEHVAAGPVAQVELAHHLPIRFHGQWAAD